MEKLQKLFEVRDSAFAKQTSTIFEQIHEALVSVTAFLNDIDPVFDAGIITWEDATLMDDMIVIIGMVEYELDTTLEVDNKTVTITEENADGFQRVVHMSLPIDLVATKDEQVITDFLYELHANNNTGIFSDPIDPSPFGEDFDLTKLTDEQRKSLSLFNVRERTNDQRK